MAGVLTAIGGAAIGASADKPRRLFAAIPLAFAAQQAAEGIVWLTIDSPAHATLNRAAVFGFLAFALVVWPTWVPWSLRVAERNAARRKWLTRLTWAGVLVSLGAVVLLVRWAPSAYIEGSSVHYNFGVPTGTVEPRASRRRVRRAGPRVVLRVDHRTVERVRRRARGLDGRRTAHPRRGADVGVVLLCRGAERSDIRVRAARAPRYLPLPLS